jgi:hypothetical protein
LRIGMVMSVEFRIGGGMALIVSRVNDRKSAKVHVTSVRVPECR